MPDSETSTAVDQPIERPWYLRLQEIKGLLLVLVSAAHMFNMINVASVTIVLPAILHDVKFQPSQLQWVVSAYGLAFSGFLLVGGRMGDLFGHRRIFIIGLTWFSIWALVNGFASSAIFMSVSRALQGMGAGFTIPSALAIVTTSFPVGHARTKALSVYGGSGAVGSVVGVLLGGVLGDTIGWRWIFRLTAILGFFFAISAVLIIPASKGVSLNKDRRVDYGGLTCFTLGIVSIVYYLSESPSAGWAAARTLAPLAVGLVLLGVFVAIQFKIDYPVMPPRIWKSRRFVASVLAAGAFSGAMNSMIFFSSLTFQNVMGYSPMTTALCYLAHGIGSIFAVITVTKLVFLVRTKILTVVGWLLFMSSGLLFAQIQHDSSYWSIAFPALILNFLGMAPVYLTCQLNAVMDAADEDQGVVGSVYNSAIQLGGPIGVAITNAVANKYNLAGMKGAALLVGYRATFYTFAIITGVGLVLTIVLAANRDPPKMRERRSAHREEESAEGVDTKQDSSKVEERDIEAGTSRTESLTSATSIHDDKRKDNEKYGS
ncbi:hypothetical protein DFQ27_006202 [Actinomortierella ambigua]|uniref:Major facilitator superfamily (MFS) profile domain-containing protein n=1 Tax=Actinomortierella ambigua TaxID=1343610 RepID=A0A9P6U1U2_9FUNG|nr:hypothetical protein DFQ27_006202 [Actinomortierella ambigua]